MKVEEKVRDYFRVIKEKNKELNVFLYVDEKNGLKRAKELDLKKGQKGKLFGMCFAVKANINVIGMPISCSSKTLENYKGTYDADVIRKIKDDDGIILGIVNCDEFACGSGQNSGFGRVLNPVVLDRVAGGSSSGSAAAVAAGMCDVALGSDTGGSVRNPASHCGIVGVKPSYGRVSRYGLVDLSMSLDQIGVLGRDVEGVAKVMEVISGRSENDPSTFDRNVENYGSFSDLKKLKIGLSEEFKKLCVDKRI